MEECRKYHFDWSEMITAVRLSSQRLDEDLTVIKGLRIMNTSQDLRIIAQRSVDTLLIQVTLDTHCRLLQL